jgi:hypothetical protein
MKYPRTAVFLVAGMFLLLIIFTGCISLSRKNPSEPADLPGAMQNVSATTVPVYKDLNSSPSKLPSEIEREMWPLEHEYHFSLNKWEFDPGRNEITLYALDIRNESLIKELQGKRISNYTIHIIRDVEFETTRAEVRSYLTELRKNPEYQIAHISMVTDRLSDTPGNYAEVWCEGETPENRKLDGTLVEGWRIVVYPMSPPPSNPTLKISLCHPSC